MENSSGESRADKDREKAIRNWSEERALITAGKRPGHNLRHGLSSVHVRKRYGDARTREGKRLKEVMARIMEDVCTPDGLTIEQELRLSTIRTSLIVLFQIGKYIDRQPELIINGDILPVLKSSFLQYSKSLREDLHGLYATVKRDAPPDLSQYLKAEYKGEKDGD